GPKLGSLLLGTDGGLTYVPNAGMSGADSFVYQAYDGTLASGPTSVAITITPKPPVVGADSFTTRVGAALKLGMSSFLANDTDPQSSPLAVSAVSGATNGTVSLATGIITFTPTAGFTGDASFAYTASDSLGLSATSSVTVRVVASTAAISQYLNGTSGNDTYNFSQAALPLAMNAQAGNDTITDSIGNDTINGGPGNDLILDQYGIDSLLGGTGSDTFVFRPSTMVGTATRTATLPTIADFEGAGGGGSLAGQDHIKLTGFTAAASVKFVGTTYTSTTTQQVYEVNDGAYAGRFAVTVADFTVKLAAGDWYFG
ncbi:MAG: Ig-like domain-containing protein, partial [Paracraurococcus sp.]